MGLRKKHAVVQGSGSQRGSRSTQVETRTVMVVMVVVVVVVVVQVGKKQALHVSYSSL
jgi:hypothetical protein